MTKSERHKLWVENNREYYNSYRRDYVKTNRKQILENERADKCRRPFYYKQKYYADTLRKKYGLSLEQYHSMFNQQQGKCKICKVSQNNISRRLVVDHCHKTGKVRGLLCDLCNIGLGGFRDDTELISSAIRYIQEAS